MPNGKMPAVLILLLCLSPGAALAYGKAGLWSVTSTTDMAMSMPPEVMAQMKKMGMKPPAAQSHVSRMCMSQAEVDTKQPPRIDQSSIGCTRRVLQATQSSVATQVTCTGEMKGTGQMQISYNGAEHYAGSYSFRGTVEGNPTSMSTSFKGDWLSADCGSVKPYSLRGK